MPLRHVALAAVAFLLLVTPAAAFEPRPVGTAVVLPEPPESCGHFDPAPAFAPDGRGLVVWQDAAFLAGETAGLRGRFVGMTGALSDGELDLAAGGGTPAVVVAPDGNFVVAFARAHPGHGLAWRRFDSTGAPLTAEVAVAGARPFGYPPALTVDASGVVVLAWVELNPHRLVLRRFAPDGTPLGDAEVVDSLASPGPQEHFAYPTLATGAGDRVLAGWSHVDGGWKPLRSRVRAYAATGQALGEARDLVAQAYGPALAALPDGGFLAAWSPRQEASLWVQRLGADGEPLGGPLEVHDLGDPPDFITAASRPTLAAGPGWIALGWGETTTSLRDRAFVMLLDASGVPLGQPVALHAPLAEILDDTSLFIIGLKLATQPSGDLLAAWQVARSVAILPSGCDVGRTTMAARFAVETGVIDPPPPGDWVTATALPGLRFQAQVTPLGNAPIAAAPLASCLPESVCFSGALAGRAEVQVRVIGPRPNGRLWPSIVRFTPSQIEVWIEQPASGELRYYLLPAVPRDSDELPGRIDRVGFPP